MEITITLKQAISAVETFVPLMWEVQMNAQQSDDSVLLYFKNRQKTVSVGVKLPHADDELIIELRYIIYYFLYPTLDCEISRSFFSFFNKL